MIGSGGIPSYIFRIQPTECAYTLWAMIQHVLYPVGTLNYYTDSNHFELNIDEHVHTGIVSVVMCNQAEQKLYQFNREKYKFYISSAKKAVFSCTLRYTLQYE